MVVGHVFGGGCDRLRQGDGSGRPPSSFHHPPRLPSRSVLSANRQVTDSKTSRLRCHRRSLSGGRRAPRSHWKQRGTSKFVPGLISVLGKHPS
jgi:hypothetical protein